MSRPIRRYGWRALAAAIAVAVVLPGTGTAARAGSVPVQGLGAPVLSDFNGDGYGDVAIGEQDREVNGHEGAGAIRVVYGSASGLTTTGSQFFTEESADVPGTSATYGLWGEALASGDFNDDGYADLAVGGFSQHSEDGAVTVLYGSFLGLHGTAAARARAELLQPGQYIPGTSAGAWFGLAMVAADFNHDGISDLAVGAPHAGSTKSGGVVLIHGTTSGLNPGADVSYFTEDTPGVPETAEPLDQFGMALAAGDFNGDGQADLAIDAVYKTVGSISDAGEVFVLTTHVSGLLSGSGATAFSEATPGVHGSTESQDFFGEHLAAGDLNADGRAELIIGTPNEAVGGDPATGMVTVLMGSATGPTTTGSLFFLGTPSERFGDSLAVVNVSASPYQELAIGAPNHQVGTAAQAGAVVILPGSATGPTTAGSTLWDQDVAGVAGTAEPGDWFGQYAVQGVRTTGGPYDDLIVCVPHETYNYHAEGAIQVLAGSTTGLGVGPGSGVFTASSLAGGGQNSGGIGSALA